jgi:hypothetical protein
MPEPVYTGTNGHRNGSGAAKPRIKQILKGTTAARRAIDAVRLVAAGYSPRQAARAAGASFGYLNTALKLTPEQLMLIEHGVIPLAAFHNKASITDKVIDRLIAWFGADRVMAGLDRVTQPSLRAAE